jgi:hypothetical protein
VQVAVVADGLCLSYPLRSARAAPALNLEPLHAQGRIPSAAQRLPTPYARR